MQQHLFRQLRRWGRATFSVASKVCSSVSSFFYVSLLRRPQTKRSRKASFRWLPNWQVEARCFRLAASAVTLWPSRCVRLRNLYLSVITIFFDAKWFFRIMVSCVYAKETFVSLSKGVIDRLRSTRNKALFFFLICLDAIKFLWLSVFTLIETISLKIEAEPFSTGTIKVPFRMTFLVQKRLCLNSLSIRPRI